MAVTHKSEIKFNVELDENKVPEKLSWSAEDGGVCDEVIKSLMVAVWDSEKKESLRIDLWTKDMPLFEMKHFYYQTLLSMADSFEKATNDEKTAADMRDFCESFARKTGLVSK